MLQCCAVQTPSSYVARRRHARGSSQWRDVACISTECDIAAPGLCHNRSNIQQKCGTPRGSADLPTSSSLAHPISVWSSIGKELAMGAAMTIRMLAAELSLVAAGEPFRHS